MKHVSFYHKDTGIFNGVLYMTSNEEDLALNTPLDHIAIDGHHDHTSKRVNVETREVTEYQPPAPSEDHEWHDGEKKWNLKPEVALAKDSHISAITMIQHLESNVQPRLLREVCLGEPDALGKLFELDRKIALLREDIIK